MHQDWINEESPASDRHFTILNPRSIPKYVNQLDIPPVYEPTIITDQTTGDVLRHEYTVDVSEFKQQILPPGFPKTTVWGYGGLVKDPDTGETVYFRSTPGPTFEAIRGIPIHVQWVNNLTGPHLFAVDPTLHWANPNMMPMNPPLPWPPFPPGFPNAQRPVPIVPHLHGGEVPSAFDGHPNAWFTAGTIRGKSFTTSHYIYPNEQQPTTLWYHDHALGMTRLNVYAGLAGFYLLRDPNNHLENPESSILPTGKYEIPLVIQDRTFRLNGSFFFDKVGTNRTIHPYWVPEFFGNTIMVNGKVWPNLNVEPRQYRFRILNGSNARFYNLKFSNGQSFVQIGSDGGFLPSPVTLTSLLIAPGERADILVDFSAVSPGTSIILENDASAPYPDGDPPDPETVGQIMQFTVPFTAPSPVIPPELPDTLNTIPVLTPTAPTRTLTLNEVMGPDGPVIALLDGQKWDAPTSELPKVGATEDWYIVNLTGDTHPIHLHLVQFLIINRQKIEVDRYKTDWTLINGTPPLTKPTVPLPIDRYLKGEPISPAPNEMGWKDTVRANPGEVTRIRVRYAPQDANPALTLPGVNLYPFDPTSGPGYVWHCHILDHEDNEMMRPVKVVP
ncbi:MAG: multicopper oxidase domain-containing protein [Thermoanaerobacteraceae bacterium]|nr:multicopper oxidase domain-containing protein [Thermoanaerobacteraceae bacterium]